MHLLSLKLHPRHCTLAPRSLWKEDPEAVILGGQPPPALQPDSGPVPCPAALHMVVHLPLKGQDSPPEGPLLSTLETLPAFPSPFPLLCDPSATPTEGVCLRFGSVP